MTEPSWLPSPKPTGRSRRTGCSGSAASGTGRGESGLAHDFYVLHLADAVSVVATTADGRLILVRQFRAGSGRDSLETPGGLLNPGEDPLAAGARELLEETGYAGDPPRSLGTVWSNPSLMTSKITTIVDRQRPEGRRAVARPRRGGRGRDLRRGRESPT